MGWFKWIYSYRHLHASCESLCLTNSFLQTQIKLWTSHGTWDFAKQQRVDFDVTQVIGYSLKQLVEDSTIGLFKLNIAASKNCKRKPVLTVTPEDILQLANEELNVIFSWKGKEQSNTSVNNPGKSVSRSTN